MQEQEDTGTGLVTDVDALDVQARDTIRKALTARANELMAEKKRLEKMQEFGVAQECEDLATYTADLARRFQDQLELLDGGDGAKDAGGGDDDD